MLANLAWRLFKAPHSPWASIHLNNSPTTKNNSFIWRNIQHGWQHCQLGNKWVVSSGNHVNFWIDNWIDHQLNLRSHLAGPLPIQESERRVSSIIQNNHWDLTNLPIHLPLTILQKI